MHPLFEGLLLSGMLSALAYRRTSLSASGAAGALGIGTVIYTGGGAAWWLVLFTFFLTSTLLARVGRSRKAATKEVFSKSDRRDVWQTLANGGVAAVAAAAYRVTDGAVEWAAAFVGALAACNADTWATELGILSTREPWLITTWQRVRRGTSGGVSPRGLLASIAGGATIGLVAGMAGEHFCASGVAPASWAAIGGTAGLIGSLVDSLLGATVQVSFVCPQCRTPTERHIHTCGSPTTYLRGVSWVSNDWVNACASAVGAATAVLLV